MMYIKATLMGIVLFVLSGGSAHAGVVWSDEFDGPTIDSDTWTYDVGGGGYGNGQFEYNTAPVSATPFGPLPLVLDIDPGVGITWFASNNVTYLVQWSSGDLGTNTVWNTLGESISGNGTTNNVFDPAAAPDDVYRVLSIQ